MKPRLPRVTARQLIRALEKRGFAFDRQRGAHKIFKDAAGRRCVDPFHAGNTIRFGTLRDILRDAGIAVAEFIELLK